MSALETPAAVPAGRRPQSARRALALRLSPVGLPVALAVGYLVLLIIHYPRMIAWQNADSDVASFYTMGAAVVHGNLGQIQLSTQGSWLALAWMWATAGLAAHRLLWELGMPILALVTIGSVVRLVDTVAGRRSAWLCAALLAAPSPMVLMCAISINWHDSAPLGAAVFAAHLVWVSRRPRSTVAVLVSAVTVGLLGGFLVSCDELTGVVAVGPYLIAAATVCRRTGSRRELVSAGETTFFTIVGWVASNLVTRALDIRVTAPPFGLSFSGVGGRARWLWQGVLRLGNGRWVAPHSPWLTPLIIACGAVTVAAVITMFVVTVRLYRRRTADRAARAGAVHCTFWTASVLCTSAAYLFSSRVIASADQYIVVIMYAVAATVPLVVSGRLRPHRAVVGRQGRRVVVAGATIFAAGSLVGLAGGEIHHRAVMRSAPARAELPQIEQLVASRHLGVGYAGYWDAAALQWSSHGRLQVHPLLGNHHAAEAMYYLRAADWYRPRARTRSYLVLAPHDEDFPDARPRTLPRPAHVYRLGDVTIDAWNYDIAAFLVRSLIPTPGISKSQLRHARAADRAEAATS